MLAIICSISATSLIISLLAAYISATYLTAVAIAGLYFPVLFIINTILLIICLFSSRKLALIPLLAIILSLPTVAKTINFFNSGSKNETNVENNIKLLSYNVRQFGASDKFTRSIIKNDILNFVVNENADIICIQEYQSRNKNIYKPLKQLRDTLNSGTYYYESYFNPGTRDLTGMVIFSKYPAINKGKLKLDGSRTFCIYTDLIIHSDTVRIFNVHLASISLKPSDIDFVVTADANSENEFKAKASNVYYKLKSAFSLRERQVKMLTQYLKQTKYKILLAGDFNDTPASRVYNKISSRLNDTFNFKGFGMGTTYAGRIPFLRIDYIFADDKFEILKFNKHKLKRSDHYPVSTLIKIKTDE